MKSILGLVIFTVFAVMYSNCKYYTLPDPIPPELCDTLVTGYNLNVKEIIDRNCANPLCHVGGTAAPGDFKTYETLKPYLNDVEFKHYVIDLREDGFYGMPPNWDTNPYNKDLTEEEFEIIQCWVDQGYPE